MNTTPTQHEDDINLSQLANGVSTLFQRLRTGIFNSIRFFVNHKWMLSFLLIGGFATGVFIETVKTSYDHYIVVEPNFGSTDYLYAKVDEINAKIKEQDTVYLKSMGVSKPKDIFKIEVKPVIDVYRFVNRSEQNFELLKLMSDDSDIKKIIEDTPTSKNYTYHLIKLSTKNKTNQRMLITPVLAYLNQSDFYKQVQKVYIQNAQIKMKANELLIAQIDGYLNGLAAGSPGPAGEKMVFYTEKTQLNDVIETKDDLVKEQGNLRIERISLDKIIKDNHTTLNTEASSKLNSALKFILPLLFMGLFIFAKNFIRFYQQEALKNKIN
ncbi:MAG: hypothetical protein KA325_02560 [Flavobacterium sp.]|jgi:hypothetical protein|nr:hypothetical protein [Flavobacterium sp.]